MDHPLQIDRTVHDVADATVVAMEATGAWARNVITIRWCIALIGTVLGVGIALSVSDWVFTVIVLVVTVAATAHGIWRAPDRLKNSYRRRVPTQLGVQLQACAGPRTLWITDAGLSDSGSGISTTIAWDRITHHVATPSRHVFCAGLAAVIDVPRRGNVMAVDDFAAYAAARMQAARQPAVA